MKLFFLQKTLKNQQILNYKLLHSDLSKLSYSKYYFKQQSLLSRFQLYSFQMLNQQKTSPQDVQINIPSYSKSHQTHKYYRLTTLQQKFKNDIKFWNGLADRKIQTFISIINLFIVLLLQTLGNQIYLGRKTDAKKILGWICVAQTIFFYVSIVIIKFIYIPHLQKMLQNERIQGFSIFYPIYNGIRQLNSLSLQKLQFIIQIIKTKPKQFKEIFPKVQVQIVLKAIDNIFDERFGGSYQFNGQLHAIKLNERNQIWWQSVWQQFIIDKTFSIPSIVLLVFIVTSISNAQSSISSKQMNNAQGWLAVAFLAIPKIIFIIIKLFFWEFLNKKVQQAQIYLNHRKLKDLKVRQLQVIQKMLKSRKGDFEKCFPKHNGQTVYKEVIQLLKNKLPKRFTQQESEKEITKMIAQEKHHKRIYQMWLHFFNTKIIPFVINSNKFLIVIALTFVVNYNSTEHSIYQAQIVVGSLGLGFLAISYIYYIILKCCVLQYLEQNVDKYESNGFLIYRQVYYEFRSLQELQIHEVQQVYKLILNRKDEFARCFSKTNINELGDHLKIILQKHNKLYSKQILDHLHKYKKADKLLSFFITFSNSSIFTMTYSFYVCLVLIVVSIVRNEKYDKGKQIIGWIGVGILCLHIIIEIWIKMYLLDKLKNEVKQSKIKGISQYYHIYIKTKQLKNLEINQLENIQQIIQNSTIDFQRCFPKVQIKHLQKKIKHIIAVKKHMKFDLKNNNLQLLTKDSKLIIYKKAFNNLTLLFNDQIYVILPIVIVIFILWAQTIAKDSYGKSVCGFLTIGLLFLIILLILFYKCWLEDYLKKQIKEREEKIAEDLAKLHTSQELIHNYT